MRKEKKIEIIITNEDFAAKVDAINQKHAPLFNAVKRALSEHNILTDDLRLGTFNINTADAQLGKLDKAFDDDDYQRLFNKFLKGIPFREKWMATIFAEPIKFEYPQYTIVEDIHYEKPDVNEVSLSPKEYALERKVKLSIPTALLLNEVMEYLIVPGI